ncbi:MAG TPA: cupin domain-containing protein [Gaiellaceae bacterium]|jgi:quercetin dioxygenase-like cupin family protein
MGTVFDPRERDWRTIERSGAEAVDGYELLPLEQGGRTRLSLTRIAAGGTFGPHIDEYAHVFCVLEGRGEVMLGKQRAQIEPGMVFTSEIREPHGIWAAADSELVLVAANVYPEEP